MADRRTDVLDAALTVLGERGVHAVTHRAVDAAAGLPAGSTSNLFRSRMSLFEGIVERFVDRERASWETLAAVARPATSTELAQIFGRLAILATRGNRTLTLARYAILVDAACRPELRAKLTAGGAEVNRWAADCLRRVGSADADRDTDLLANFWTGMVLHELAMPDPAFDPASRLTALLTSLLGAQSLAAGSPTR